MRKPTFNLNMLSVSFVRLTRIIIEVYVSDVTESGENRCKGANTSIKIEISIHLFVLKFTIAIWKRACG